MRNLKKILALVLALVMSLSLMATAGASQFPDVDEGNPYATAIDVLDELKVFQGFDDGTFKPTETLNRAQAAVLVYRIATGDVENKYLDNYTFMQQSKFTDLDGYNWAKGYINYCQNAGIVVGTSATTFDPGAKVTGYQLLVMLLRTLGYGKAGEFADPKGWELKTATIAESEGITKNVTSGDFGAPAPRQMVAEILFRGLLTETVEYSALIPGGYTKSGETLGMREFGLEKVSGVVMANEWANLEGDSVAKADTTIMKVDEKNITVNKGTELDAVGLTYNAYIANGEGSVKRALTLEAGDNTVAFNEGKAVATNSSDQSWTSIQKLADEEGISIKDNTEFFVNYSQAWNEDVTSDYRISYAIAKTKVAAKAAWAEYVADVQAKKYEGHDIESRRINVPTSVDASGKIECWYIAIRPDKLINTIDQEIMEEIFYSADRLGDNNDNTDTELKNYAIGEVYVGTTSMKDYSDTMSWKGFKEEYFNDTLKSRRFATCEMGNSLRIVDNDGDGEAEYALKIAYTQAQAISGSADALILSDGLRMSKYSDNNLYSPDELALDDIINYYIIDGKLSAWKADKVTGTISDKSFQHITVTVTDGETYGQSGINNETRLDENILAMADRTEYNMYLDEFGYIRTYELAQGKQYALLTEIYPTNSQNWNYVTNHRYIAEMQVGDEPRDEHLVSTASSDIFYSYNRTGGGNTWYNSGYVWTQIANQSGQGLPTGAYYNYLQPAVAHLGYNRDAQYTSANLNGNNLNNGATTSLAYRDNLWGRTVYQMTGDAFNYGTPKQTDGKSANYNFNNNPATPVDQSFSYTNIALYTMDGEEVLLSTAAQKATDRTGNQLYRTTVDIASTVSGGKDIDAYEVKNMTEWRTWYLANITNATSDGFNVWFATVLNAGTMYEVYATDYVQLVNTQNYPAGNRHFTIAADYNTKYFTNSNTYVDAVDGTEFYIVGPNNVLHVVGYSNLPAIDASTIRAAYAVAKNTAKDQASRDYWVADVIVIEVNNIGSDFDSISLMYYNPNENFNSIRYVKSLNDDWRSLQPDYENKAMMDVVPSSVSGGGSSAWGNHSWTASDYGFYFLYDTDLQSEGSLSAGNAVKVTRGDYNKYGIFAATVSRVEELYSSGYIDVIYNDGAGQQHKYLTVNSSSYETPVYRISTKLGVTSAEEITLDNDIRISDVQPGDKIIYVYKHGENGRQVSYIVDIAQDINSDGVDENHIPAWLYDTLDGLWADIDFEQRGTNAPVIPEDVNVGITLAAGETATFKQEGHADQTLTTSGTATLKVPEGEITMTFQVEVSAGVTLGAIVPAGWRMIGADRTGDVYTIYMIRNNIPAPALLSANAAEELAGTIYTVKAVEALLADAATLAGKLDDGSAKPDEVLLAADLLEKLTTISNSKVPGATITGLDTALDKTSAGSLANELDGSLATEAEKKTATDAVDAMIASYKDSSEVVAKADALKTAINNCVTKTQLTGFYSSGLVTTTAEYIALQAAINKVLNDEYNKEQQDALDAKIKAACDKVDAMAAPYAGIASVETPATALKNLIKACVLNGVAGDKTVAATDITKYWTGTDLVTVSASADDQTVAEKAIVALKTAIEAADDNAEEQALKNAQKAAVAAADALLEGESDAVKTAVASQLTALKTAINQTGDMDALKAIYDPSKPAAQQWAGDAYTTLKNAIAAEKAKITTTLSVEGATVTAGGTAAGTGKYTVTIASESASTNVTFSVSEDATWTPDNESSPSKYTATFTFTLTDGCKVTVGSGVTLAGDTYTVTVESSGATAPTQAVTKEIAVKGPQAA